MKPLLTRDQAMELLAMKRSSFERLVREGRLRPVYVGERSPRFREDDIEDFITAAQADFAPRSDVKTDFTAKLAEYQRSRRR